MSNAARNSFRDRFTRLSTRLTAAVGSPFALFAAAALIVAWLITGPIFNFSDTWQLFINTTTTVVTFLMVFVIQASQNRDSKALHLKLDEVIRAQRGARNELIETEQATEEEIHEREEEFLQIAKRGGEAVAEAGEARELPAKAARTAEKSGVVRAAARTAAVRDVQRENSAPAVRRRSRKPGPPASGTPGSSSPDG
jgi:low affinity Fe/Cu permease